MTKTTMIVRTSKVDEQQPLLQPNEAEAHYNADNEVQLNESKHQRLFRFWPWVRTSHPEYRFVPWIGCALAFLGIAELMFEQVPLMRAIEAMYCYEHYRDHGDQPELVQLLTKIPERLCKADTISQKVVQTASWSTMFRMICSCIGAFPLGRLSDRKGRKVVLILCKIRALIFVGWPTFVFLTYPLLPVWSIYFSALGALIGGTLDFNISVIITSYVDVVLDPQERFKLIYFTTSVICLGQLIVPPIGSFIMNLDGEGGTAYIPLWTSFGTAVLSLGLTFFAFPETFYQSVSNAQSTGEEVDEGGNSDEDHKQTIRAVFMTKVQGFKAAVGSLGLQCFSLLEIAMLLTHIGIFTSAWFGITQFPIIKLNWNFEMVNFMISFQAAILTLNTSILLPFYTNLGATLGWAQTATELTVMLVSTLILIIGSVGIGLSASNAAFIIATVVCNMGTGLPITMQAFVSNLIARETLGSTMSLLTIANTGGKLISSAATPWLFGIGIASGNETLKGLPMFVSAVMFGIVGVCIGSVGFIRWRRK